MSLLPATATRCPHSPALSDFGRTVSYGELATAAARMAGALAARGIGRGDRVATCLPTTLEHAIVIHGIGWLGAVVVPLHPRLAAEELEWQIHDAGPRLVVTARDLAELFEGDARPEPFPAPPGEIASILYTSGTTGRPKLVPLTWANHQASLMGSLERLGTAPDDDWLCPLPLAHVGGLAVLYRSAALGTAATLLESFDPEAVAALLAGGRITVASMVPTMVRRLLGLGRPLPAPRLRWILLGGGPVDAETFALARARCLPLVPTYGLTETASQLTTVAPGEALDAVGTVGRPLAGAEVEVRDHAGLPVVPPDSGTIWVRGPMVMAGYLDRPEENAARFDAAGWFSTGDLGRLDAQGYLTVEARREDLIVSGGENVYPAEVEAALFAHPAVADCAVVGLADPEWGQRAAAAVVLHSDRPAPSTAELVAHLRARLAPFKIPKTWAFRAELPRTASGKLQRALLRAELG
jgi:O-succinylbenzoic acid--CoA ligase